MPDPAHDPIDPPDFVVITRARLQDVVDAAVERGCIARRHADELVAELLARGRAQADELLTELGRTGLEAARRVARLGPELPIADYDELTAAEVLAELDGMSDAQLRALRDYEKANANRKTVLGAIERKLA